MARPFHAQICRCGHLRMFHAYPVSRGACDGLKEVVGWEQGALGPYGIPCHCRRFRNVDGIGGPSGLWLELKEHWSYWKEQITFHAYWVPRNALWKWRNRRG